MKASFTVGVFGLACKQDPFGKLRIKLNVRTDQVRQRKLANLPEDSTTLLVDCPGGTVDFADFPDKQANLLRVLRREVEEETGGCQIEPLGSFSQPFLAVTNIDDESKPSGDIAFWMPIKLIGEPQPSDEAMDHPWISLEELEDGTVHRPVSGLGMSGRTGRMIKEAFSWFRENQDQDVFS